jgi:hypothetical protein
MTALPTDPVPVDRHRSAALHVLAILALVWTVAAGARTSIEVTERGGGSDLPTYSPSVVAQPSTAHLPLLRVRSDAPAFAVAVFGVSGKALVPPTLRRPLAERRDPPPALFERVAYRTTGPPLRNGCTSCSYWRRSRRSERS